MVKLQKTDIQQRRYSQQFASSSHAISSSSSSTVKTISNDSKQRTCSHQPRTRHDSQTATPPPSWSDGQIEKVVPRVKTFEHTPSLPERSFVATGREEFLRRANLIAETRTKKMPPNATAFGGQKSSIQPGDFSPSIPSRDPRRSSRTSNPGQSLQSLSPTEFFGRHRSKDSRKQQDLNTKLSSGTSMPKPSTDNTITSAISRKRSTSLPALVGRKKEPSELAKTSNSTQQPDQTFSPTTHLPFAPKIDLESILDSVTTSYNEKLAEAQRRSNMLWRRTFTNQREENRQAGLIKKRQTRRVSSPALMEPSFATHYKEMKPGSQPHMIATVSQGPSAVKALHNERTSGSIDLSDTSLIHPAFRTKPSTLETQKQYSLGVYKSDPDEVLLPSPTVCSHCGQSQTSDASPTRSGFIAQNTNVEHISPIELASNEQKIDTVPTYPPMKMRTNSVPDTPTEVSIAERIAASRAILLATSSQESVTSSRTCDNVDKPKISPIFHNKNRSDSDFWASTKKDGWPMRMTNWKGPFAAKEPILSKAEEVSRPQRPNTLACQNTDDVTSQRPSYELDLAETEVAAPPSRKGRSLRKLIIENDTLPSGRSSGETQAVEYISQPELQTIPLSRKSSSIYSTDIPSPLLVSHDDDENIMSTTSYPDQISLRDGNKDVSDESAPVQTSSNAESSLYWQGLVQEMEPIKPQSSFWPAKEDYSSSLERTSDDRDRSKSLATPQNLNTQFVTNDSEKHFIAIQVQPRVGPQSLTQFRNNCRPVDTPSTPVASPSSTKVRFELQDETRPQLRRKPQIDGQVRHRKRLSKTRPTSQDMSQAIQRRRSHRHSRSETSQNSISENQRESLLLEAQNKRIKDKRPAIPPRTKAGVNTTTMATPMKQNEERQSRSRLPPNSFPTSKCQPQAEGRSRSRSRSRIRSLLQTIGIGAKDEDPNETEIRDYRHDEVIDLKSRRRSNQMFAKTQTHLSESLHEDTSWAQEKATPSRSTQRNVRS